VERVRLVDEQGELIALAVRRGLPSAEPGLSRRPTLHPDLVLIG
jgi:hypothetical protein